MRKLLFILFLFGCIDLMAFPHHIYHHHIYHHHRVSKPTYHTPAKQYRSVRVVRQHRPTRVLNTFYRNGVLYFIILHPRRGYVYNNDLVLCEGCGKVLVKKRLRYCHKCIEKKRINACYGASNHRTQTSERSR